MFHVKRWRKWFHVKHRGGVLMRMNVSRESSAAVRKSESAKQPHALKITFDFQ
jgi:hypothetical protein